MAEQHAIGGGERQRVAGRLFPGEMLRLRHQLARLHAAELRERAVRRLVAPDALRGREQRIAAIAFLVVAVVLIAMDDDFVADLPALHLGADRPDDAGRIRARDVIRVLVHVERRDRLAEAGPDAVVIDARRHHEHEHFVVGDRPGRHHLDLHRGFRRPVALLADRPGVHFLRHMAERRDFADVVEVLRRAAARGLDSWTTVDMARLPDACALASKSAAMILHCNRITLRRTDKALTTANVPGAAHAVAVHRLRSGGSLSACTRAQCGARAWGGTHHGN